MRMRVNSGNGVGAWGLAVIFFLLPGVPLRALEISDRSISRSGQFVLYCERNSLRLGASTVAEDTRERFLEMLRLDGDWVHPIVIRMVPRPGAGGESLPGASLRLMQTEQGPKIQLDILTGPTSSPVSFREEIVRALLLERTYRGIRYIPPGTAVSMPPVWMVLGLTGMIERREGEMAGHVFGALVESGNLPDLGQFLTGAPPRSDWTSFSVYKAYSMALTRAVLDLPGGREKLLSLASNGGGRQPSAMAGILRGMAEDALGEGGDFDRWWILNVARFSEDDRAGLADFEESVRALQAKLKTPVHVPDGDSSVSYPLDDPELYLGQPGVSEQLSRVAVELSLLASRSNPMIQPVAAEIASLVTEMAGDPSLDAAPRFDELRAFADKLTRLGSDIDDYMNWVEATQIGEKSGGFERYFQAARQIGREERRLRNRRHPGPVGTYLDEMEEILGQVKGSVP